MMVLTAVSGTFCLLLCHLGGRWASDVAMGLVSHVSRNSMDMSQAHGFGSQAVRPLHGNTGIIHQTMSSNGRTLINTPR